MFDDTMYEATTWTFNVMFYMCVYLIQIYMGFIMVDNQFGIESDVVPVIMKMKRIYTILSSDWIIVSC